jgi:hypothetical protein
MFRHKRKYDTVEFSVEQGFQTVALVLLGVSKQLTRGTILSDSYFLEIPSQFSFCEYRFVLYGLRISLHQRITFCAFRGI